MKIIGQVVKILIRIVKTDSLDKDIYMDVSKLEYRVVKAKSDGEYSQMDLIVLFLLDGKMTLRYQGDCFLMKKEDIVLINPGMNYEVTDAQGAMYGIAIFPLSVTSQVMESKNMILYANSVRDSIHSYQDLRNIFYDLTAEYTMSAHQTKSAMYSLMLQLLDCLIENYQMQRDELEINETDSDARMREMMQYIVNHITDEINLSELAGRMFVSTSTLSRILKKNTGMYFADYVMQLRVKSSLGLLHHSDQNLTQIAMNCGFSNSASFNRAFKKLIGMTPSDYREKHRFQVEEERLRRENEERRIREELREKGYQLGKEEHKTGISIDFKEQIPQLYHKVWSDVINIGDMNELTRANTQFHVEYLQEQLRFRYVRLWNVFSVKMLASDGRTLGNYNFDVINQALDFLVQKHLKPFLDLGRRPDTAVRSEGKSVYYKEEYIPFVSERIWEDFLSAFLTNLLERYGEEEVSSWIFELSQERFHIGEGVRLFEGERYDFFFAWKKAYRLIKKKIPKARFGGIPDIIDHDPEYVRRFFENCVKYHCEPDYMSMILFPYEFKSYQVNGVPGRYLSGSSTIEFRRVQEMKEMMADLGLGEKPLYVTEWNNSISNRNFLNDSCFRAAYIIKKIEELWGETDLMVLMAGSDWISSYLDTTGIVNGSIGLLTKDAIRKPAFYAVDFLNQLGSRFIARGENYIASVHENGDLSLLCFRFDWIRGLETVKDEDIGIEQYERLFLEDENVLHLKFELCNIGDPGDYVVKKRILNRQSGSILDEWRRFQYEPMLTRQDVKYLQAVSTPRIEMQKVHTDQQGRLSIELKLQSQEVELLHIYKKKH